MEGLIPRLIRLIKNPIRIFLQIKDENRTRKVRRKGRIRKVKKEKILRKVIKYKERVMIK